MSEKGEVIKMPFKECIRIHDKKTDGSKMRPSGSSDAMDHWAFRLAFSYLGAGNQIVIAGAENDIGIEVWIGKDFWKNNPGAFDHIMNFIKSNDLAYSIDREECKVCAGRSTCVSKQPDGYKWMKPLFSQKLISEPTQRPE